MLAHGQVDHGFGSADIDIMVLNVAWHPQIDAFKAKDSAGSGDRIDTSENKSGEIDVPNPGTMEVESRR